MATGIQSIISQFTSFFGGPKLIVGDDLSRLAKEIFTVATGIVAHAGGGQALATPLGAGINSVDTVASGADSVMLPPAIPGREVVVINNTATSMQVFGNIANQSNGGAGDTIAIQGSTAQVATGTGVAHASGVKATYYCAKIGQWQRGSTA